MQHSPTIIIHIKKIPTIIIWKQKKHEKIIKWNDWIKVTFNVELMILKVFTIFHLYFYISWTSPWHLELSYPPCIKKNTVLKIYVSRMAILNSVYEPCTQGEFNVWFLSDLDGLVEPRGWVIKTCHKEEQQ